eukprot:5715005-Pleurochrysis_carterae.AAC.1
MSALRMDARCFANTQARLTIAEGHQRAASFSTALKGNEANQLISPKSHAALCATQNKPAHRLRTSRTSRSASLKNHLRLLPRAVALARAAAAHAWLLSKQSIGVAVRAAAPLALGAAH